MTLYWRLLPGYLVALALPWLVLCAVSRKGVVQDRRLRTIVSRSGLQHTTQPRRLGRGDLRVIQGGKAA